MISLSDLDNVPPVGVGSSGVVTTSQTAGGTTSWDLSSEESCPPAGISAVRQPGAICPPTGRIYCPLSDAAVARLACRQWKAGSEHPAVVGKAFACDAQSPPSHGKVTVYEKESGLYRPSTSRSCDGRLDSSQSRSSSGEPAQGWSNMLTLFRGTKADPPVWLQFPAKRRATTKAAKRISAAQRPCPSGGAEGTRTPDPHTARPDRPITNALVNALHGAVQAVHGEVRRRCVPFGAVARTSILQFPSSRFGANQPHRPCPLRSPVLPTLLPSQVGARGRGHPAPASAPVGSSRRPTASNGDGGTGLMRCRARQFARQTRVQGSRTSTVATRSSKVTPP